VTIVPPTDTNMLPVPVVKPLPMSSTDCPGAPEDGDMVSDGVVTLKLAIAELPEASVTVTVLTPIDAKSGTVNVGVVVRLPAEAPVPVVVVAESVTGVVPNVAVIAEPAAKPPPAFNVIVAPLRPDVDERVTLGVIASDAVAVWGVAALSTSVSVYVPNALAGTANVAEYVPAVATVRVESEAVLNVPPVPDNDAEAIGPTNPVPVMVTVLPYTAELDESVIAVATTVKVLVAKTPLLSVTLTVTDPGSAVVGTVKLNPVVPKVPVEVTVVVPVIVPTVTPLNSTLLALIVAVGVKPTPVTVTVAPVGPDVGLRVMPVVGSTVKVVDAVFGVAAASDTVMVYVPAASPVGMTIPLAVVDGSAPLASGLGAVVVAPAEVTHDAAAPLTVTENGPVAENPSPVMTKTLPGWPAVGETAISGTTLNVVVYVLEPSVMTTVWVPCCDAVPERPQPVPAGLPMVVSSAPVVSRSMPPAGVASVTPVAYCVLYEVPSHLSVMGAPVADSLKPEPVIENEVPVRFPDDDERLADGAVTVK